MSLSPDLTLPVLPLLPGEIPASIPKSSFLRLCLNRGLDTVAGHKKMPAIQRSAGLGKTKLNLPPATQARLQEFCEKSGASKSDAYLTLSLIGIKQIDSLKQKEEAKAEAYIQSPKATMPFDAWCDEQTQYWQAVQPALIDNHIVLAEGSTGIGKGRVLAAAAAYAARKGKGPVWVTSSTPHLVGTLFEEFQALPKKVTYGLHAAILPGRQEFVSTTKLKRLQESFKEMEPEQAEAVDRWIEGGGPVQSPTPLTRSIEKMGLTPCWMAHDLIQIAPSYPIGDVVVTSDGSSKNSDPEDVGTRLAADLRIEAIESVDVFFATHAMIGRSQQNGWRMAPPPKFLIVDETHLFEQAIAFIRSKRLSLFSLKNELKKISANFPSSKVLKDALNTVDSMKDFCLRFDKPKFQGGNSANPIDLASISKSAKHEFAAYVASLAKLLKSKSLSKEPTLDDYRDVLSSVVSATDDLSESNKFAHAVLLAFSPDRRYPSLQCGPRDVGSALGALWKTAENGGIAASATIYTRSETGEMHGEYLARLLAIPLSRIKSPPPVIAPHIFKIPVLHKPGRQLLKQHNLLPPKGQGTEKENKVERDLWINAIASICAKIVAKSRGGTLIPCTSYSQIKSLSEAMVLLGVDKERIECSKKGVAFSISEKNYRAKYKQGLKPVFIALGPAWTGISLIDDTPAEQDFLLTDLIIPRMPVGLNRTVSMQGRIDKSGLRPIIQEASMATKQGFGRLIRRTGVTDRHLWVLDGRIWQPELSGVLAPLGRAVARMLKDYRKMEEIAP